MLSCKKDPSTSISFFLLQSSSENVCKFKAVALSVMLQVKCNLFISSKYDLYSKSDAVPDVEAVTPYYEVLIAKYCPGELCWWKDSTDRQPVLKVGTYDVSSHVTSHTASYATSKLHHQSIPEMFSTTSQALFVKYNCMVSIGVNHCNFVACSVACDIAWNVASCILTLSVQCLWDYLALN